MPNQDMKGLLNSRDEPTQEAYVYGTQLQEKAEDAIYPKHTEHSNTLWHATALQPPQHLTHHNTTVAVMPPCYNLRKAKDKNQLIKHCYQSEAETSHTYLPVTAEGTQSLCPLFKDQRRGCAVGKT